MLFLNKFQDDTKMGGAHNPALRGIVGDTDDSGP
jgi:hypothetical protein